MKQLTDPFAGKLFIHVFLFAKGQFRRVINYGHAPELPAAKNDFQFCWPLFPRHTAFSSEGGYQGRYRKGGTTMKSSIRTFVLAAIAASTIAASTHSASAQAFEANYEPSGYTLPSSGPGTINAIILPNVGTYVIGGEQRIYVGEASAPTHVFCWAASLPGSTEPLPYGPLSMTTIMPPGGYATLPLSGYYTTTTAQKEIWVSCDYEGGPAVVSTLASPFMATQVK
jgi:hypothetical protein